MNENSDEMPHNAAFHLALPILLRQKRASENKMQFYFEIITCDPLICAKPPVPLDGDSATISNFGQNDKNRSRNGKSAVEAPRS